MIICIEGPTGAGKSKIALQLAQALDTGIINSDSRQIYKYMDIGTAKPDKSEWDLLPHYLFDIVDPDQKYNAGLYVQAADTLIKELESRDKQALFCGGTGLYIRSLLEGLFEHPPLDPSLREELRQELAKRGLPELYAELEVVDPEFAAKISTNDPQRILRGLEIYRATGKTMTQHWAEQSRKERHAAIRILILPPRQTLYQRINRRLDLMVEVGLIKEIESLLARGYNWDDPGMNSLGYKEFRPFFEHGHSLEECVLLAKQHHRNYAKRQITWYRKQRFDLTLQSESFNLSHVLRVIQARLLR